MNGLYYREPEDVLIGNMCDDDECDTDVVYDKSDNEVIEDNGADIDRVAGLPNDDSTENETDKHITNKIADELETEISGNDDDSVEYDIEDDDDDDLSDYDLDDEDEEDDDDEEVF